MYAKLKILTKKKLNNLYNIKRLSSNQIAKIYNCSVSSIATKLQGYNIRLRNHTQASQLASKRIRNGLIKYFKNLPAKERTRIYSSSQKGDKHPSYKKIGTIHTSQFGKYKLRKIGDNTWQSLHRFKVEKYLGRKLKKTDVVHHIDENTHNNKLSNLYVFPKRGLHTSFTVLVQNKIISLSILKSNLKLLKNYKRYV